MTLRAAVHPFPARMAPELVQAKLDGLTNKRLVLDPMMGSGSFVVAAAQRGHHSVGVDSDPLTHVMVAAATAECDHNCTLNEASDIALRASKRKTAVATHDTETSEYIDFWFDPVARKRLAALATEIRSAPLEMRSVLWCAFSRLIITKDAGASRARDVSHSRPHRVREFASFDPIERFAISVETVLRRRTNISNSGRVQLIRGDARRLPLRTRSVDSIMTSPPYLIAIDYLRGHRMSLVWMGYTVSELRILRSSNIGAERGSLVDSDLARVVESATNGPVSDRTVRLLGTYVRDLHEAISEVQRVLKTNSLATFVIANARHMNSTISVESIVSDLAENAGLNLVSREERVLPPNRRYLPPPTTDGQSLDGRMHTEVVVTFEKLPKSRGRAKMNESSKTG